MVNDLAKMVFSVWLISLICASNGFVLPGQLSGRYNVDPLSVTVSGFSSGASMATQLHVAHSSTFHGVAILSGIPYFCAESSVSSQFKCMGDPPFVDVMKLITYTRDFAIEGQIDDVVNMRGDKFYIFHGINDTSISQGTGEKVISYYEEFLDSSDILAVMDQNAGHGFPTNGYGNPCEETTGTFINNCEYSAAYELLNHFYGGNLEKPDGFPGSSALVGDLMEFSQGDFTLSTPESVGLDSIGYAYIPSQCQEGVEVCRLHVAFHGCSQGRERLGEEYARYTGYLEVAELNNIIVIFPQAKSSLAGFNLGGCWDVWGFTDDQTSDNYVKRAGVQIDAIYKMVQRVINE